MIKQILKSVLFVVLVVPLASLGMEGELDKPDKIELGKQLAWASDHYDWDTVEDLIAQGADANQRAAAEWTALMNAASQGQEGVVRLLIDAGADLNLQGSCGRTALMIAARWKRYEPFCRIDPICHMIVEGMFKQNNAQKMRIYTFLLCLKRIPGFANTNQGRDLFQPILLPTIMHVEQEINRIKDEEIRELFLEKYGFQPITNAVVQ